MKSVPLLVVCLNIFSILSPSWAQSNSDNQPDPATGLTPKQKRTLRSTWGIIRKDPLGSGEAVLLEYLARYPHYHGMFTSIRNVTHPRLANNPAFQKLSIAVIDSLSSMIDSLDKPDVLVDILLTLGEDHKRLGVTKKQYIELKDTMLSVLGKALGQRWDNEVSTTWDAALNTINSVIFKTYA